MEQPEITDELLKFFKALADGSRLKIVGVLAEKASTVEDLASHLHLSASTVSHHLARLEEANLVTARVVGHHYFYSLQTKVLEDMSRRILQKENQACPPAEVALPGFDQKVLDAFILPDGRIKAFPSQEKKLLVILRHVLQAFEKGVRYSEKEVNEILKRYHEDSSSLRRAMVDYQFMAREGGGGDYWRL
jgi:predicted transcriptional regulator